MAMANDKLAKVVGAVAKGHSKVGNSRSRRVEEARPSARGAGVRRGRTIRVTNNSVRAGSIDNGVVSNNRTVKDASTTGGTAFNAGEEGEGQVSKTGTPPIVSTFNTGSQGGGAELPDRIVEGKDGVDERGDGGRSG